jgi:hypothetical protein
MNGSRLDLRHRSCSSVRHVVWFSVAVPGLQSGYVGCRSISSVEVHSDYRVCDVKRGARSEEVHRNITTPALRLYGGR